jgi:hypothetical protein
MLHNVEYNLRSNGQVTVTHEIILNTVPTAIGRKFVYAVPLFVCRLCGRQARQRDTNLRENFCEFLILLTKCRYTRTYNPDELQPVNALK